ncbi:MAG: hydrogenase formation protein HypD [Deltaproteobacteria bacterium]|nr:hydrogenase formation protein HypD [Deltaproteobacteria bacterium]
MRYIDEYRDPELSRKILDNIRVISRKRIRLMEVCGTHTMAIFRSGIRALLPETITILSGPGCPVCVTSQYEIDTFIEVAGMKDVIVATFGDLMRVPGTHSSLQKERAEGKDIRIVYSAFDALDIAESNPQKEVVFLGIGFETTAPTIAASIVGGEKRKLDNFSVLCAHKLVPPALAALMAADGVKIDGFICPGHVSVIIGSMAYLPVVEKYNVPCVVSGFEPADILQSIYVLVKQIKAGDAKLQNEYRRAVAFDGNERARQIMYQVFEPTDARWRGIGMIPQSGLNIRREFDSFNAEKRFDLAVPDSKEPKGCACGEILMGMKTPPECPLYKKVCTPTHPVGPCMVSTEGTCAAYYKYHA